jgi:hypothetical protein
MNQNHTDRCREARVRGVHEIARIVSSKAAKVAPLTKGDLRGVQSVCQCDSSIEREDWLTESKLESNYQGKMIQSSVDRIEIR